MTLFSAPRSFAFIALALALLAASGLRADVTIRYQKDFKLSAGLPPMMEQAMKPALAKTPALSIRMKGNKAWSMSGDIAEIVDLAKQELTLIDTAHHTFATFPASEFAVKMAAAVPQIPAGQMKAMQSAMSSIKTKVDSKVTGRTDVIQGVQAEEREIDISMDMPMPADKPQTGPSVRLVMQIWNAKPGEALRVPAIRELTGYNLWQKYFLNPAGTIANIAGKMPGIGEMVTPMLDEILKNQSVILRIHMDMYMPFMAVMARRMAEQKGETAVAFDPDAPIIQMNQEVVELSDAPVDVALFEIPKEYTAAPADDLIRGMVQSASEKSAGQPQSIRVGSEVQSAKLIRQPAPVYPPEAKAAGISGRIILNVVVAKDGTVKDVSLVSGHPFLVAPAEDAVKQWVYKPTLLNGEPVEVLTQVEVNFTPSQ
jgi:TonB family protein